MFATLFTHPRVFLFAILSYARKFTDHTQTQTLDRVR